MTGLATLLLFVGLFLGGGAYSFAKQKQPKGVTVLLAICAVFAIAAGLLRIEW